MFFFFTMSFEPLFKNLVPAYSLDLLAIKVKYNGRPYTLISGVMSMKVYIQVCKNCKDILKNCSSKIINSQVHVLHCTFKY